MKFPQSQQELHDSLKKYLAKEKKWLDPSTTSVLEDYLISVTNYFRYTHFNANLLISSSDPHKSIEWGNVIARLIAEWSTLKYARLSGDDLSTIGEQLSAYESIPVFIIDDLTESHLDVLFDATALFEKNNWSPILILCTTPDIQECIGTYSRQDFRLSQYIFRNQLHVGEPDTVEQICDSVLSRLSMNQFYSDNEEDFRKELFSYVDAVYNSAQLQGDAFVEDLVYRICQEHFRNFLTEDQVHCLTSADIPYSAKAELKKREQETEEKPAEQKVKELPPPATQTLEEYFGVANLEDNISSSETRSGNILLLALSTINRLSKSLYSSGKKNEMPITGFYQLDPIPRFLIGDKGKPNITFDEVIMFCTQETLEHCLLTSSRFSTSL